MEDRTKYIGGSDVGAILGVNPWRSPLDVFYEKTGLVESENIENEKMYWGKKVEPLIIDRFREYYCENVSSKTIHTQENVPIKFHHDYNFLGAHIDCLANWDTPYPFIIECKTTSQFNKKEWGEEGSDIIPESYKMQVAHYLNIYDLPLAYIAVLFGGNEFKVYKYHRNIEFEKDIEEKLVNFWENNILKLEPPLPISIEEAKKLYVNSEEGKTIVADNDILECYYTLCDLNSKLNEIENEIDEKELTLMNYMTNNELLISNNGEKLCSWKNSNSMRLNQKDLKLDFPDLYSKYLKESISRPFRPSIVKKEK